MTHRVNCSVPSVRMPSVSSRTSPAKTFTLDGPDIRSVTIASDNDHFAAFGSVILDNFTISSVPEPSSLTLASIASGIVLAYGFLKRRNPQADLLGDLPRGTYRDAATAGGVCGMIRQKMRSR